jgi:hypothetical protein
VPSGIEGMQRLMFMSHPARGEKCATTFGTDVTGVPRQISRCSTTKHPVFHDKSAGVPPQISLKGRRIMRDTWT